MENFFKRMNDSLYSVRCSHFETGITLDHKTPKLDASPENANYHWFICFWASLVVFTSKSSVLIHYCWMHGLRSFVSEDDMDVEELNYVLLLQGPGRIF
jgi:hypothetical protein